MLSYLRRSASSVRNTVQSSSFLRGSVLTPLKFSWETLRGSGGTPVGLSGVRGCELSGSFSVEKDLGTAGTGGTLTVALKRPLRRLFFLLRGARGWMEEEVVFASEVSGMLAVLVVFRLLASWIFVFSSFLDFSREGDVVDLRGSESEDTIHDFLRSFDMDRAGETLGESSCLTASLRPRSALRSDLRSALGSLLRLEKERNLDDRRELMESSFGLSSGICSISGSSSEEGLDPPELSDVLSPCACCCNSPSEMVPFTPTTDDWSRSSTRGKYVNEAALLICGGSFPRGDWGPTSEAARLLPRKALEKTLCPRLAGATAAAVMASVAADYVDRQRCSPGTALKKLLQTLLSAHCVVGGGQWCGVVVSQASLARVVVGAMCSAKRHKEAVGPERAGGQ